MAAEPFRTAAPALLFDGFEHSCKIHRVVTSSREDLRSEHIRLSFVLAAVFEKVSAQSKLSSLRNDVTCVSADDRAEYGSANGSKLHARALRLRCLSRSVPQCDVTDFVRHHS